MITKYIYTQNRVSIELYNAAGSHIEQTSSGVKVNKNNVTS